MVSPRLRPLWLILPVVLAVAAACTGAVTTPSVAIQSTGGGAAAEQREGPTPTPAATAAATAEALPVPAQPVAVATAVPTPPGPPPPARMRELPPPALAARAAVVVDGESGAVLYDKDARTPLPPASTTKILTALLAIERGNLDEVVEVALDDRRYWGSVMGLVNGDRFTLRDLLYGLMLPSGNDAAYVIAAHIAGSERAFAGLMNDRSRELGLTESQWVNASGLGREESNLVSAHDLAQIARAAMAQPEFVRIVNTRAWTARGSRVIGMRNGNELLYAYPGADGVKIGFGGRLAGNTVVGSATRGGHRLFVVALNTPDRPGESAALLNWAYAVHDWSIARAAGR